MAAAPWYLLAGGIVLVILGFFLASLGSRGRGYIDPRMSDKEIARQMEKGQGSPVGGLVIAAGFLVILASIIWRIVRVFV